MKSWACSANRRKESALPQAGSLGPPFSVLVVIELFLRGTIGAFYPDVDRDSDRPILTARSPVRLCPDRRTRPRGLRGPRRAPPGRSPVRDAGTPARLRST